MTMDEACAFLKDGQRPEESNQILDEIGWFLKLYKPQPSMYVAYDRIAMTGRDDPSLRLTFDSNVRWRTLDTDLSCGTWGKKLIGDDQYILEIKANAAIPVWLADDLSELGIYKTSFSKYGRCFLADLSGDDRSIELPSNIIDIAGVHDFKKTASGT
jgi:hypothetical protein